MTKFEVIAEFVDLGTGDRILPAGEDEDAVTFTPHDEAQALRLTKAGCLRAMARDPLEHDSDGARGGSLKGERSTVAKGRRKKAGQEG